MENFALLNLIEALERLSRCAARGKDEKRREAESKSDAAAPDYNALERALERHERIVNRVKRGGKK